MGESVKPIVVISGVNFADGGPLAVMKEAIAAFLHLYAATHRLYLIVHARKYYTEFNDPCITFFEFPVVKSSWLKRLQFEYRYSKKLAKQWKPYLWLSMHDITPGVQAERTAVYCHNPAPFYSVSFAEAKMEPSLFAFSILYKNLYRINIKTNRFVIVQQDWIRDFFEKNFKVNNVVVAYPDIKAQCNQSAPASTNSVFTFIYPAFPRVFKNFETLLLAAQKLEQENVAFKLIITIDGTENKYAARLHQKFGHLKQVHFIGLQPHHKIQKLYAEADALVFPSKLETWGLPISEMKTFDKPIIVAKEKYAVETVGSYEKANFFSSKNFNELAGIMEEHITGTIVFHQPLTGSPRQPFVNSWPSLMHLLME